MVDTIDPLLSTIDDASGTSTDGDTVTFRVTFSEPVDALLFEVGHFSGDLGHGIWRPSAGGVSSVTAVGTAENGGHSQYDVLVSGAGGDAGTTVTLSYNGEFTVTDMVGNTGGLAPFVETDSPGSAVVFDVFEIPVNNTDAPVEVVIDNINNSSFSNFIAGYHGGGAAIGYRGARDHGLAREYYRQLCPQWPDLYGAAGGPV